MTASDIALERFQNYLAGKLKSRNACDESRWEFFNFLLEQAENHQIDNSGYASLAYQEDRAEARKRTHEPQDAFRLPERKQRSIHL